MKVKAGDILRTKARRGYKYIIIEQVRTQAGAPAYILAHEVHKDGSPATGRDRNGLFRNMQLSIPFSGGELPPWYEPAPTQ